MVERPDVEARMFFESASDAISVLEFEEDVVVMSPKCFIVQEKPFRSNINVDKFNLSLDTVH